VVWFTTGDFGNLLDRRFQCRVRRAFAAAVSLDVGEAKTYEWKSVGKVGVWTGYFLAVADIPTKTWRLGQEKEAPLHMAEKNNTMAIPFPTKK